MHFFHSKHCFWMSLRWPGQPFLLNPLTHPIFFLPSRLLGGSDQQDSFNCLIKRFAVCLFSDEHNHQPAFPYLILPFFVESYQQEEGGDSHGIPQGPPTQGEEIGRKVIPGEGEGDCPSFRRPSLASHRSSKTLMSYSFSLRNGDNISPFW